MADEIVISTRETLKVWFSKGKRPLGSQFYSWINSFHHKYDGILIKHPTEQEEEDNVGYMEVQTINGNVRIPKSGDTEMTLKDVLDRIKDSGYITIEGRTFEYRPRYGATTDGNIVVQAGDIALNGWVNENLFATVMVLTGSDPTVLASWTVLGSVNVE